MKQNVIENSWQSVKIQLSDLWSKSPWSAVAKKARTPKDTELREKALNTWEDEGGKPTSSAPVKTESEPSAP